MVGKLKKPPVEKQPKSREGKVVLGRLKNLDKDGSVPDSRLETALSAHEAFVRCETDAYMDRARIISIRGIYDRHPPLSQQDLDEAGLGEMPNINTGQFPAKVDTYASSWLDLDTNGDAFCEVMADDEFVPPSAIPTVSGLLSRFMNDAILDWAAPKTMNAGHYIHQSSMRNLGMGLFGIGIAANLDQFDWRFTAMPLHRVLVPRGTFLDMNNCQMAFIKWKKTLPELWEEVRDEDKARAKGWNPVAVKWAIYKHQSTSEGAANSNWTFIKWMNECRDNDPDWVRFGAPEVKLVHCYVMEFEKDGEPMGISHRIIPAGGLCEYGYLFSSTERYEAWQNVIIPFCDRVGPEGIWHGIKGFGDDIYDACHFQNMMFNWTATNAILNGLPCFTSSDADSRNRLARVTLSRMGIIYPGLTPQQFKLNLDIEGSMMIFNESNAIMENNTRVWGQAQMPQTTAKGKPSPTEIVQAQMQQTQFSSIQIKNYRTTGLDPMFSEMYRRLTQDGYDKNFAGGKQAAKFRERCERHGITKKMYQNVKWVRATRSGGTGNGAVDFQRAQQTYNVATPGKGQLQARKDMVAALNGREVVAAYVEDEPGQKPDDEQIDNENQIMDAGQTPNAMDFQDHLKHLGPIDPRAPGHIGNLLQAQQKASQIQDNMEEYMSKIGSDPLAVVRTLDAFIAHSVQHTKAIAAVPVTAEAAKPYNKILNDVHGFAVQFAGNVQKALMARQPNSGEDPKVTAIKQRTLAEIKSKDASTAADIHRKNVSHMLKMQNLREAHQARQQLKIKDATLSMGLKAEQTMGQIEMDKHRSRKAMASVSEGDDE